LRPGSSSTGSKAHGINEGMAAAEFARKQQDLDRLRPKAVCAASSLTPGRCTTWYCMRLDPPLPSARRIVRQIPHSSGVIDQGAVCDAGDKPCDHRRNQNTQALCGVSDENRTAQPVFAHAQTRGRARGCAVLLVRRHRQYHTNPAP
jgi:hypothetical protein